MQIVCDSSVLLSPEEGKRLGTDVFCLHIAAGQNQFKEYVELSAKQLLNMIQDGVIPTSSQPSVGEKLEYYEQAQESILDITMADGLSGTYQSALMARAQCEDPEQITVFNSKTLCGPHRQMVLEAVKMAGQGKSLEEIIARLEKMRASDFSCLIPQDYSYLQRGGRLSRSAALLGNLSRMVPVLKKAADGRSLDKLGMFRTWKGAVKKILDEVQKEGKVHENTVFYVCDANNRERAESAEEMIKARFPFVKVVRLPLSCAFVTQGGPGCVSIQCITAE